MKDFKRCNDTQTCSKPETTKAEAEKKLNYETLAMHLYGLLFMVSEVKNCTFSPHDISGVNWDQLNLTKTVEPKWKSVKRLKWVINRIYVWVHVNKSSQTSGKKFELFLIFLGGKQFTGKSFYHGGEFLS